MGVLVKKVPVSVPFHCELLKPAAETIKIKLDQISVNEVSVPIIMNYDGNEETDIQRIKEKLYYQTFNTVQWIDTLSFLYNNDVTCFIECGPGRVLTNFTRRMRFDGIQVFNIENNDTLQKTINGIKK